MTWVVATLATAAIQAVIVEVAADFFRACSAATQIATLVSSVVMVAAMQLAIVAASDCSGCES